MSAKGGEEVKEKNEKRRLWVDDHPISETVKLVVGLAMLIPSLPWLVFQMAACTFWEFGDKKYIGMIRFAEWVTDCFAENKTLQSLVKFKQDVFMLFTLVWLSVVIPAMFAYEWWYTYHYGLSFWHVIIYNLLRIGPMYRNFMNIYVLSHKEVHMHGLMFQGFLKGWYPFNWWAGLFYGVMPGTFMYSHLHNHHIFHNHQEDVVSTWHRPRDEIWSYIRYLVEWNLYAINVTTIWYFRQVDKTALLVRTMIGTIYYTVFVGLFWHWNPWFAVFYLLYPSMESNILLSMVNFVWHAFIEESDPNNDFVNSTTVIEGLNFTLAEEYHVVHHQYPGAHWTMHEALFQRHWKEYEAIKASIFYKCNVFEMFVLMVTKQYAKLAEMYYDPNQTMTMAEKEELIKRRLQYVGY